MRLARLEMHGFKSFMSRTELNFEEGITAVLGPNGCGKSNVVDALRWVLGAQSPKLLRGAKMENVIFDGTKKRAPMGVAEVAVTFTGASERLPVEWDEITIKRRTTRAGGSEYFLNNQPYRLHEIRDLLSGTGLGNHVYAIIERDVVEEVLAEGGDKRRLLFEEASGITKYKLRRKESLSKLSSTEADLTRLEDILSELGRNVRSLKYQMGRAKSYQRLQETLREAELYQASRRLHLYWGEDGDLGRRLGLLGDESRAGEGQLAVLDEEAARFQADLLGKESHYQEERDRLEEQTGRYRKHEEELAVLEEKARAEERQVEGQERESRLAGEALERLAEERETLAGERERLDQTRASVAAELGKVEQAAAEVERRFRERRDLLRTEKQLQLDFARSQAEAGGELERLSERLAQSESRGRELSAEAERLQEQEGELRSELGTLLEQERRATEALADAQRERDGHETRREELELSERELDERRQSRELHREKLGVRLDLLERLQREGTGYPEGTRWLLENRSGEPGLLGALAQRIQVAPEQREAVEAALADSLGAAVVESGETAARWLKEIRTREQGRAFLLSLDPGAARVAMPAKLAQPPGLRPLLELIETGDELEPVLGRLLARHYLAPDAETALAAIAQHPERDLVLLTPEGFLFRSDGLCAGGSTGAGEARPLARADEITALEQELADLLPEIEGLSSRRGEAVGELGRCKEALQDSDRTLAAAREELAGREMERARLETRLARLQEEREGVAAEQEYQGRQAESLAEARAAAEGELGRLTSESPGDTADLPALEEEVAALEQKREGAQARLAEKRLEQATTKGSLENLVLKQENLERAEAGEWSRQKSGEEGAAESRRQIASLRKRAETLRASLGEMQSGLTTERESVELLLSGISALREKLQDLQTEGRRMRDRQREKEQVCHGLELERNTLAVKMADLQQVIRDSYDEELDPATDPEGREGWRPAEGESVEEALEKLHGKIDRIGVVNLMALEEYEEKSQRYEFLLAQKEDLVGARDGLLETIQRINREARQRFADSFRVIRKNFTEIFTTLFEGGEADLSFSTTEDDPLQAEIVVTAKPKEKNISNVQLLSTGEKTLTALSLLFAIYLSKPSPFCVFDEVDAPLDDANIQRFLRLVKDFSQRTQFLLITHNKRTMEVAGHLYGVTMEESGISKVVSGAFEDVPDELEAQAAEAGRAS